MGLNFKGGFKNFNKFKAYRRLIEKINDTYLLSPSNKDDGISLNDPYFELSEFTFEFWMKYNDNNAGYIFDQNNRFIVSFEKYTGTIGIYDDNWHDFGVSNISKIYNTYIHYAVTINSVFEVKLFIDGNEESTITIDRIKNIENDFTLFKGVGGPGITNNPNITEVRLWNKKRTKDEINKDKDYRLNGNENNLIMYFPLNEGEGTDINELANNIGATYTGSSNDWVFDSIR